MDFNPEIEDLETFADDSDAEDSTSVDDFIRELEAKEKDLHITADTTIIEIAQGFDDSNLPEFIKEDLAAAVAVRNAEPETERPEPEPSADEADESDAPGADRTAELEVEVQHLEKRIIILNEKISKLEADRDEMFKSSQRRTRDLENYKARTERERRETLQTQVGNLATQMLPALDNLHRAVEFAMSIPETDRNGFQQFFEGIVLVNRQIIDVMGDMGIQPIATVGELFDPHFHEAVATEDSDEFPPNTVCEELLRGYRIGDKVVRHSMVKVTKATAESPAFELEREGLFVESQDEETESAASDSPDSEPPQ
jgi:molecular chaperone GrpE